ncbi:MAG: response regulator, partial [Longimicrobiales bacterium]|nr:response regulator [Longimicrobiales bacterium]
RRNGAPAPAGSEGAATPGAGTVLLAEDRDDVRQLMVRLLQRMDFTVLPARRGDEALALLERERDRLALVVADLVMPRGGGAMLLQRTRAWARRPPFLIVSGLEFSPSDEANDVLQGVPRITKPFTFDELRAAVERAMARAGATPEIGPEEGSASDPATAPAAGPGEGKEAVP